MSRQALKVVLVGTGGWARQHALALRRVPDVELAAIVGHSNRERLDPLAAELGVPGSLDLDATLAGTRPAILDVACNPHLRLEAVRLAADHGVGTVNLEKPLALTCADGHEIRRLCAERGIKLTVNHQKKFMPGWRDAAQLLRSGELGAVEHMQATCRGNLLEQGTHLIDMLLFFNEFSPPRWVLGQVGELEGLRKPAAAAPDLALAELCLANGVRGVLEFGSIGRQIPNTTSKWWQFAVEVLAERGHLSVTLSAGYRVRFFDGRPPVEMPTSWDRDLQEGLVRHFTELARYARDEAPHISRLEHAMLSFDAVMAIYQSALSHSRVEPAAGLWPDVVERLARYGDGGTGTHS